VIRDALLDALLAGLVLAVVFVAGLLIGGAL
jgi:hypothetical protein